MSVYMKESGFKAKTSKTMSWSSKNIVTFSD